MIINKINEISKEIEYEVINIRRSIHKNPELAFEEYNTCNLIVNILKKIGFDEIEVIENTGVIAILRGSKLGDYKEKTIMLRADMDALAIKEETNLDFKSKNDYMHACGHDAHVAWALGTAKVLFRLKHLFRGNVKFLFQPGEEIGGAVRIVKKGVLDNHKVDIVMAGHCWPDLDSNEIGVATYTAMSSANTFKIIINGKGGHGAKPHECIDPISIGTEIYSSIQKLVSRKTDPKNPKVISVCSFNSGTSRSTISDICTIEGTVRAITYEEVYKINKDIEHISQKLCEIYGATCIFEMGGICLPVINNKNLIESFMNSAKPIIGENNLKPILYPAMTGEDFSEYSSRRDGLFLYIGCRNKNKPDNYNLHSCKFDIDESILKSTVDVFSKFIIDYFNKGDKNEI